LRPAFSKIPKASAKRSQHANATYPNIVGSNMLCAFGHRVAMCCDMLGVVGSSLKMVKLEPTTHKTSQQGGQMHTTCCAQQCCNMLLWHVAIVWPKLKTWSFHVVVLQRTAKKCTKIQNARAQPLSCSFNLLFGIALVPVAFVVCLHSLFSFVCEGNPGQTIATCQGNTSQHCWGATCYVRLARHPVATCCLVLLARISKWSSFSHNICGCCMML